MFHLATLLLCPLQCGPVNWRFGPWFRFALRFLLLFPSLRCDVLAPEQSNMWEMTYSIVRIGSDTKNYYARMFNTGIGHGLSFTAHFSWSLCYIHIFPVFKVAVSQGVFLPELSFLLHQNHKFSPSQPKLYQSRSLSHVTTDGQSVLVSSPIWGSWSDINYSLTFTVLSISGAPSDKRSDLSFVLFTWTASVKVSKFAAGPRQLNCVF
jgi:hypothetical protein